VTGDLRAWLQAGLGDTYTFGRELGGSGMSHVFVAEDNALGRRVVVKVLRPELAEGLSAERFKREIRLAARLQHPHIVPLLAAGEFEAGSSVSLLYFSMPLVEGESLRSRLTREGNLPLADAIGILRDVTTALAYAHRHGIIHRDIKPENILLADGGAVVTDFGIAKAISAARDGDVASSAGDSTLTQRGTSLGTPAYMAPEQAAGDAVDHRADFYALGVVTYEMLAGRPPFLGRSAQQLMAAHATERPEPIEHRRGTVPQELASLVMALLAKEAADRPQSADAIIRTVDAIATDSPRKMVGSVGAPTEQRVAVTHRRRRALALGLPMFAVAAAGLFAWLWLGPGERTTRVHPRARFVLDLPAEAGLNIDGPGNSMVFSPDGSRLAYIGGHDTRIFVRHLDSLEPRPLAGTALSTNPQYSPDGRWIGFLGRSGLRKVPASGGPVTPLAPAYGRFVWTPDGGIVHTANIGGFLRGLHYRRANATKSEPLTLVDSALGTMHGSPTMLADGRTVLFTAVDGDGNLTLAAMRIGERTVRALGLAGSGAIPLSDSILVFSRMDGSVAAVRFDARRLRVRGDPVKVLDSVAVKSGGVAQIVVAANGTMAYLPGVIGTQLVLIDRQGRERLLLPAVQNYSNPRVSPDGRRVAVSVGHPPYVSDIWIYDLVSGTFTRVTTGGTSDTPEWSPDGQRIAWTSVAQGRAGIWWQPWDGSEPPQLLVPGARLPRFTPRGEAILASFETSAGMEVRLVPLPLGVDSGRVLLPESATDRQYRLSPDGRWLAYVSDETGTREVYVQRVSGPGGRRQVSSGGGVAPVWAGSGREIVYINSGCCTISATVDTTRDFTVTKRDTLFSVRGDAHPVLQSRTAYDVMPDGRHFLLARLFARVGKPIVVFDWAEEVHERLGVAQRGR
jgi:eukaryotic-like serine/threonine-protein kinase